MPEEMIEEVNWEGKVVAVHPKSELKKRMFPHRVALVIPKQNGKLLLCRRAKDKHPFPDTWCCAIGGKVAAGESYATAASRETKEEAGVDVALTHVTTFAYNKADYQALFAVFTADKFPADALTLDPSEIQYLKGFTPAEIKKMIADLPNEFAPTFLAALDAFTRAT